MRKPSMSTGQTVEVRSSASGRSTEQLFANTIRTLSADEPTSIACVAVITTCRECALARSVL